MSRQRDQREAKALAYLKRKRRASAYEIGRAALLGEPRAGRIPRRAKESIGLSIGLSFVRRGIAQATRDNQFRLN
jgi:hypothetical protein